MVKTSILLPLLIFFKSIAFGQVDINRNIEIKQYAHQLDSAQGVFKQLSFKMDTVQIDTKKYENRITAKCLFEKSRSYLTISYYLKSNNLILASVKEQSPKMDMCYYESLFFYSNNKLTDDECGSIAPKCFAEPMNKSIYQIYGYNPSLDKIFLEDFVMKLYNRL